jgi:predicted transcriptional regulator of viral defense system
MSALLSHMPTFSGKNRDRLNQKGLTKAGLGAFFRPSQVERLGIEYDELQRFVASGVAERVGRGLYRLTEAEPTENYSLAAVAARVPRSVICLLSALRVHGIGSQVPREVWLAIPHKARAPRFPGTRIRLLRFSGAAWTYGVVDTSFEGVPARITNPTRTVVDCFRFERLIGREAALDALRDSLRQRLVTTDSLFRTFEVLPSRRLRAVLMAMP